MPFGHCGRTHFTVLLDVLGRCLPGRLPQSVRATRDLVSPDHFWTAPTANTVLSPRRKILPPEIAGEARKRSSSWFLARTSSLRPARSTNVSPVSLTRYTLPSPATGDPKKMPSRRTRHNRSPVEASARQESLKRTRKAG